MPTLPPDAEERRNASGDRGTVLGKVGTAATERGGEPDEGVVRTVTTTTRTTRAPDDDLDVYPEGSPTRGHDTFRDDRVTGPEYRYEDRARAEFPDTYPESSRSMADEELVITPVGVMPDSVRASAGMPPSPVTTYTTTTRTPQATVERGLAEPRGRPHLSPGAIVSDVAADLSMLVRQEVDLAKAEFHQSASRAGRGMGAFAAATGAGLFGLLFLLVALMFGLHAVMALGWAALIVGCLLALCASGLALFGLGAMRHVHAKPTQTVETLKEDMQWAHGLRK
jgi:hypothetical protein